MTPSLLPTQSLLSVMKTMLNHTCTMLNRTRFQRTAGVTALPDRAIASSRIVCVCVGMCCPACLSRTVYVQVGSQVVRFTFGVTLAALRNAHGANAVLDEFEGSNPNFKSSTKRVISAPEETLDDNHHYVLRAAGCACL